jgi:hypothetical protein
MYFGSCSNFFDGDVARRGARRSPLPQGRLVECKKEGWLGKAKGRNDVGLHNKDERPSSLFPKKSAQGGDVQRRPLKQGRLVLGSKKDS